MGCKGLHCRGCGHGASSGLAGIIAALAVVLVLAGSATAIGQAVTEVIHVIMLTALIVVILAVVSAAVIIAVRLRSHARTRAHAGITQSPAQPLSGRVMPRQLPASPARQPWETLEDRWLRVPADQRQGPDPYGRD